MFNSRSFFITGTDTDVGKTQVACALLQAAQLAGYTTLGLKPVASGGWATPDGLRTADALHLQANSSLQLPYPVINPYAFAPAIAPHIAAAQAGIEISLDKLQHQYKQALAHQPQVVLVEGAGGWLTPLSTTSSLADLAWRLRLPVILVVGLRLGCLNHALLSAQTIQAQGLHLAGWIANTPSSAEQPEAAANLAYLQQHLPAPCLGCLPYVADNPPDAKLDSSSFTPEPAIQKAQLLATYLNPHWLNLLHQETA